MQSINQQRGRGDSTVASMKNSNNPRHWIKKRNELPYRCEQCQKTYLRRGTLIRHKRYECMRAPQYACMYCQHKTKQRSNLNQHIQNRHPGQSVKK